MSQKIIRAKEIFLTKMEAALVEEKTIDTILKRRPPTKPTETREQILTRLANDLNSNGDTKDDETPSVDINISYVDYMDNFVARVQDEHQHEDNVKKLRQLISTTRRELTSLNKVYRPIVKKKRTLHIRFQDDAIRPTHKVLPRNMPSYHWELKSDTQPWSSIGIAPLVEPQTCGGQVRLHFNGNEYISNTICIESVIRRQASTAKRKQYRFTTDDLEFKQRCTGVAGRILRLISPPVRNITSASFDMRVFQDRVSQLPEHLDLNITDIIELCEENDTSEHNYVAMVEFIDPVIHLNPKKLYSELKAIYEGLRIQLIIDQSDKTVVEEKTPKKKLFILEEPNEDDIVPKGRNTRRQRKQEEDARLEQERLQFEKDAQEKEQALQREQEEITRKNEEEDARLERERLQLEDETREKEQALQREQEEITRKNEEEDARLEQERLQLEVETREKEQALQQKQEEREERTRINNEKRVAQHDINERQQEKQRASTSTMNIMKEYDAVTGKNSGQENSGGNQWFIVKTNVYKTTKTNNSPPRKKTMGEANAAGWYSKDFFDQQTIGDETVKQAFLQEQEEITRKNKEEDARLEQERLQLEKDAQEKEQALQREQEEITRKNKEEDARLEQERLQLEKDAQEKEQALQREQEEITRKNKEEDARLEQERLQLEVETREKEQALQREQEEITRKNEDARLERERLQLEKDTQEKERQSLVEKLSVADKEYIKYVFDWYDKDPKDGHIELSELTNALTAVGSDSSAAKEMLLEYDKDGNGNIDYDEFVIWCATTNAVQSWKKSNLTFGREQIVEDKYSKMTMSELKKYAAKLNKKKKKTIQKYSELRAGEEETLREMIRASEAVEDKYSKMIRASEAVEDKYSKMSMSELKKYAAKLNKKKKKTIQKYSELRAGDEETLREMIRASESKMSTITQPSGELSEMLQNMTDDWVSSDEELNFAVESENEDLEFAASSAIDTDDSDMDFAEVIVKTKSAQSSGVEFAQSSGVEFAQSSDVEFAQSSGVEFAQSSDVEFAASSAIDTDSDMEFATSSGKNSSGLDFADSSAVESD